MGNNNKESRRLPLLTRLKLLISVLIGYVTTRSDGSPNRRVLKLVDLKASAPATKLINAIPISTFDITIDPSRNLWFRIFIPTMPNSASLPLIVYFHGGGFTKYGPDSKVFDHLCTHVAARVPAVVASVNYRLAPEHKCPTQYEDAFDALKFIDARHFDVLPANADLARCFIGGDSAGANIAHHVTVRAVEQAQHFHKIRIVGMLGLQPFFGGQQRTESELRLTKAPMLSVESTDVYWREFLPEGADRNHPAANVTNSEAAAALTNLDFPTSLVIVGGNDPLQDWDRRYVEWLQNCGKRVVVVEYPNAFHGFYAFPELPEFALLINDVANFVRDQVINLSYPSAKMQTRM